MFLGILNNIKNIFNGMVIARLLKQVNAPVHEPRNSFINRQTREIDMSKLMMSFSAVTLVLVSANVNFAAAASATDKSDKFKAVVKKAQAEYKAAKQKCSAMSRIEKNRCLGEARARIGQILI